MRTSFMTPKFGRGKELADLLRVEFGMPEVVRSFSVHFDVDDVIVVRCEYLPKSSGSADDQAGQKD
jgi:hypothetical protein